MREKWVIAIRRDERPEFAVTGSTVVCSDHFVAGDFFPVPLTVGERGIRRLKPGVIPSVFAFKPAKLPRVSPDDRHQVHQERLQVAQLPVQTVPTVVEALREKVKDLESQMAQHSITVHELRMENSLLRSQLLRYENVRCDDDQLLFFTGLSTKMWDAVWKFLKPWAGGIRSSRASVDDDRRNSQGAGRPNYPWETKIILTIRKDAKGRKP